MRKAVKLLDLEPASDDFLEEALSGLRRERPSLPCKYFYDATGAALFEQICETPEYYPTRTEIDILRSNLPQIAELVGPQARVVEYGAGAGSKTRLLLNALDQPSAYTPIDISRQQLIAGAEQLQADFEDLELLPVCADYATPLNLPQPSRHFNRSLVFFPGSTIGNFEPDAAVGFLKRLRCLCEQGDLPGQLLLGVDRKKDRATLEAAYNDQQGHTARFNLNLLSRLNQELGASFELDNWSHKAHWNADRGAMEMHLVSQAQQVGRLNGDEFYFAPGQSIHTEDSFKYHPEEMDALASEAGFKRLQAWSDPQQHFQVALYQAKV